MMPSIINCTPVSVSTPAIMDAQPRGVSVKSASTRIARNATTPKPANNTPAKVPIRNGNTEKFNNIDKNKRNKR